MQVELKVDNQGNLYGRPINDKSVIDGMVANGADRATYNDWPLFVQGHENAIDALKALEVTVGASVFPERHDVDEWTFRHLCGYQND